MVGILHESTRVIANRPTPPFASSLDFGGAARLCRRLGPNVTELGTQSVNVHMRRPLPSGAYFRWRSDVKNPQVTVDEATDRWTYRGEALVRRWSEWHRRDAPCRAVNAPNRYRFEEENADRLPLALRLLENHRGGVPLLLLRRPRGSESEPVIRGPAAGPEALSQLRSAGVTSSAGHEWRSHGRHG